MGCWRRETMQDKSKGFDICAPPKMGEEGQVGKYGAGRD
jgi:hypothetical protein